MTLAVKEHLSRHYVTYMALSETTILPASVREFCAGEAERLAGDPVATEGGDIRHAIELLKEKFGKELDA